LSFARRAIEPMRPPNYASRRAAEQPRAPVLWRAERAGRTLQNSIPRAQTGYRGAKLPPYC
jgi:hypothetical protein